MEIVLVTSLAALAFYIFVVHMLTEANPFLSREPFLDVNYVAGMIITFLSVTVAFSMSAILPTMMQSLLGYPALTAGEVMVPRGLGAMMSMALAGCLVKHVDARILIASGIIISAVALWDLSLIDLNVSQERLMWNGLFQGLGIGLTSVPVTTFTFATLANRYLTESAAIFGLIRNFGTAIGVSITITMITRMTQANHATLTEHISPFNQSLETLPPTLTYAGVQVAAMLESEIARQASMMAYVGLYRWLAVVSLVTALALLLVRMPKRAVQTEQAAAMKT